MRRRDRDCLLNLCLRGQGVGGQGSQMKQIKGEPWPPGETLAGCRDGIQMGSMGGVCRGSRDSAVLSLLLSLFFLPPLSHRLKLPKRAAAASCPVLATEVSR